MANVRGNKGGKVGRNSSDQPSFQEIVQSNVWSDDEKCHYLIVDLPGTEFSSSHISCIEHDFSFISTCICKV